jgi:hypothetical protein
MSPSFVKYVEFKELTTIALSPLLTPPPPSTPRPWIRD